MARTVRDAKLETRAAREKLKVSPLPYFRAIEPGLHLGYRKGKAARQWVMRTRNGGKYVTQHVGAVDDAADADGEITLSFAQAQARARKAFLEAARDAAGLPAIPAGPYTVSKCLDDYIEWLTQNGKTAADTRWRADALILPDLGKIECAKLTTKQIVDWLNASASAAPRLRTKKKVAQRFRELDEDADPDEARRRRRASANRVLTILKAALNRAWRERLIPTDNAWRAVKPFPEADAARTHYLSVAEAKRLTNASEPDFRRLVQAALYTGARYSELAAMEVADFNPDAGTVHIRTSKSGKGRHVVLTQEGAALFKSVCAGRGGRDRIFLKEGGGRWLKNHQVRPMADACIAAKIEPTIGFHGLRHTYASLTIMNGAPLLVVAKNLGHADTRMVEKHYGHLSETFFAKAIREAVPRFGFEADSNVVAL